MGPQNKATVDIRLVHTAPCGRTDTLAITRPHRCSVVCVCLLATTMSPTKMVQSQMTFEVCTQGTREGAL